MSGVTFPSCPQSEGGVSGKVMQKESLTLAFNHQKLCWYVALSSTLLCTYTFSSKGSNTSYKVVAQLGLVSWDLWLKNDFYKDRSSVLIPHHRASYCQLKISATTKFNEWVNREIMMIVAMDF